MALFWNKYTEVKDSYKCLCKKKKYLQFFCTELNKCIHSIQYSLCRSLVSFAIQSAKVNKKNNNPTDAGLIL